MPALGGRKPALLALQEVGEDACVGIDLKYGMCLGERLYLLRSSQAQPPREDAASHQQHRRYNPQRRTACVRQRHPKLEGCQPHRVPRVARVQVWLRGHDRLVEGAALDERLRGGLGQQALGVIALAFRTGALLFPRISDR